MEDCEKDSPQKPVFNFRNTCRCCNKTVLPRNHPVEIFGERINKEPEFLSKFSHKHLRMTVNNTVFAVFDFADFITPRLVISEN